MNYLVHPRHGGDEAKAVPMPGTRRINDYYYIMSIPVPTFIAREFDES